MRSRRSSSRKPKKRYASWRPGQAQPDPASSVGFQGWPTPQQAIGPLGVGKDLTLQEDVKAKNDAFIKDGFTRKQYWTDDDGTQYSTHYNPATGNYKYGKKSSSEDPDWDQDH